MIHIVSNFSTKPASSAENRWRIKHKMNKKPQLNEVLDFFAIVRCLPFIQQTSKLRLKLLRGRK